MQLRQPFKLTRRYVLSLVCVCLAMTIVAPCSLPKSDACSRIHRGLASNQYKLKKYCDYFHLCNDCGALYEMDRVNCSVLVRDEPQRECNKITNYNDSHRCMDIFDYYSNIFYSIIEFNTKPDENKCSQSSIRSCFGNKTFVLDLISNLNYVLQPGKSYAAEDFTNLF